VLEQRAPGLGRRDALARAQQQARPERLLHVTDARRGGTQRKVRALGAVGDAARLDHVAEEVEVGEVEAHMILPVLRRMTTLYTHCLAFLPRLSSRIEKLAQRFATEPRALRPATTLG